MELGKALKLALRSLGVPKLGSSEGDLSFAEGSRVLQSPDRGVLWQTLAHTWQSDIWTWHLLPPTEGVKIASHQRGLREAQELLGLIYLAWFPLTVLVNQFGFDSKNNSVLRAPRPCLSVCNCYLSQWRG